MSNQNLESKLTPAAREALEELVESYRDQILIGAMRSAASFTDEVAEVPVRDILTSVNRGEARPRRPSSELLDRLWRMAIPAGIVYAIAGFGYFVLRSFKVRFEPIETASFAVGLVGLVMSLIGYYYSRQRRLDTVYQRALWGELRSFDRSMLLVQEWRNIELAARSLVASHLGESVADKPISILIDELYRSGILTKEDVRRLRDLLSRRNRILHDNVELERNELELALREASRILSKLEGAIQQ